MDLNKMKQMQLIAKGGSDIETMPAGMYEGICIRIIHLGLIPGSEMFPKPKNAVRFEFELEDGNIIGAEFTLSMGKKSNLLRLMQTWTESSIEPGDGWNVFQMWGKRAKIQLELRTAKTSGNEYNHVLNLAKGASKFKPKEEAYVYSVDQHDQDIFDKLPEFLQESVQSSDQWKINNQGEAANPANPTADEITKQAQDTDVDDMFG